MPKSLVCLKKSKLRLQLDFRRAPLKGIKKQGERAERAEIKMTAFLAAGVMNGKWRFGFIASPKDKTFTALGSEWRGPKSNLYVSSNPLRGFF